MKHTDMSKLAQKLRENWYEGSNFGPTETIDELSAKSYELQANYVASMIHKAADAAVDSIGKHFPQAFNPQAQEALDAMRKAIMDVIPKDDPIGPFGAKCKCWVRADGKTWTRAYCTVQPHYAFCPFCGEKRVTQ